MDAWLSRMLDRFGGWYLWGTVTAAGLLTNLIVTAGLLASKDYFGLNGTETVRTFLVVDMAIVIAIAIGLAIEWPRGLRSTFEFSGRGNLPPA